MKIVSLFLTSLFFLSACGNQNNDSEGTATDPLKRSFSSSSQDLMIKPVFDSPELKEKLLKANATVRIWYLNAEGNDQIVVAPVKPLPALENMGDLSRVEMSTASGAGQQFYENMAVSIKNFPMGKKGTEIGVEFLEQLSDGGFYVTAYGVYRGPSVALTSTQLKADLKDGLTIYSGRSCGSCNSQEAIQVNANENLFRERCGSGINPLRVCAWIE